ncbi:MAG: TRASH domain-containing protein [Thermoplasmata archaeon]
MKKNMAEIEQRMLSILKVDSRKSIVEIAKELEITRITAKKVFESLIQGGRIRTFTITTEDDERDLVLLHVSSLDSIPQELIVEAFSLVDQTFEVVMYYENLLKVRNIKIFDVKIAFSRTVNMSSGRKYDIHCDYCGAIISSSPISLTHGGRTYYACCPNCENDLRRRLDAVESLN